MKKNNSLFVIPSNTYYYIGLENESSILNYVSETIIYLGRIDGFFGPLKEWFYKTKYLIKCRLK